MAQKNIDKSADKALRELRQQEILALAARLYTDAKARVARGQDLTQDNLAILNNARRQLHRHKS